MNQLQSRAADASTLCKMLLADSFRCVCRNSLNAVVLICEYIYQFHS